MTSRSLVARRCRHLPTTRFLGAVLAACGAVLAVHAQPVARPASDTPPEAETITLNPFEVSAAQDYGYQAITTQAGGRINTDLKDTPATISILTKEFMEDLGLDNLLDFSLWAPNADIPFTDNPFLNEYRTNTRGLTSFGSRNYFRSYAGGDIYNTERLEYARGPNALLFGDANIGGITTVFTKQARLNRSISNLQAKFDSYGSYRASFDYNFSRNNRFAVRANALYNLNESWRDVEQTEDKGLHLAMTVGLAKNTQFRLEGEYFEKTAKVPFSRMVDQVSNYLRLTPEQQAAAVWTTTRTGSVPPGTTRWASDRLTVIQSLPDAGVLNYLNRGRTSGSGLSLIPAGRDGIAGFPELPSREFNPNAPSAEIVSKTSTASAYLDQRIGENLFLQAAVNWSLPKTVRDEIRWDDLYIDVNTHLPSPGASPATNGIENPYYGQIFGDEESRQQRSQNELYEYRLMAAWKFENSWTSQSFSALVSQREDAYLSTRFRQVPRGIKSGTTHYSSNSTADLIYHRRYWNDLDGGDYVMPATFVSPSGAVLPIEWRQYEDTREETTLTAFQIANVGKYFSGRLSVMSGFRHDKYDRIASTIVSRHGATSPDNGAPNEVILDPEKRLVQTESSPSIGAVYWLTKGIGLSANYAESFNLAGAGAGDIYGRVLGPSNGVGEEFGLRFDLFDSRLTGSVLYYETESQGGAVTPDATNVYNRIRDIWAAIDTTRSISTFRDTQDSRAKGYELELVYNPNPGWRMRLTAGKPRNIVTNRMPALKQYIAENRGTWAANGGLPTVRTGAEATVQGTLDALDLYLENNVADGVRSVGNFKWNATYFTSYRFRSGKLRGLTVGAGARYTSERFIARTSVVGSDGRNQYTEWWNDDNILFNAMAKYDFRLNNKPATIQLNVENLLDNDDIIYRNVLTVGGVNYYHSYQWVAPLKIVGTATIRF